jgi:hypothetical protein
MQEWKGLFGDAYKYDITIKIERDLNVNKHEKHETL